METKKRMAIAETSHMAVVLVANYSYVTGKGMMAQW
jgi:hypothetical protein